MRLEFHTIAGEDVPTVVAPCNRCGGDIFIRQRDFLLSRPLDCDYCHHQRYLSYREFITFADAIAFRLLHRAVSRHGSEGNGTRRL